MASLNKCMFIGNLGSKPEVKFMPSGQAVSSFSVACNEKWTDKQGQKQEKCEWIRCVAWGKTAELCGQYLDKGKPVYVEGRMGTRQWQDKDGKTNYTTEITVSSVQFLGAPSGERAPHPADQATPAAATASGMPAPAYDPDSDIPF